jgi:hypothetical protein
MTRRFRIIGCAILLFGVAALALWWHLDREPEYKGKPLAYWVDQILTGQFQDGHTETFAALRSIGPPAAKLLVPAMVLTDSPLRRYYTGVRSKLPASLNAVLPHQRLDAPGARNNAFSALCQMGRKANGQVPELVKLLKHRDKQVRIYGVLVLACIGPEAMAAKPALLEVSRDAELSPYVAEALRQLEGGRHNGGGK